MHSIQIIYLSLTFLASISIQCNSLNLRGAQVVSHTALKVASTNDDVLHMADGAVVPVEPVPNRRRMTTIGTVSVLVVRVTSTASDTDIDNRINLAEYIFDTDTNREKGINVQSQFYECSNGAFQFTPFNGETRTGVNIANGMHDYHINRDVTGEVSTDIRREVRLQLNSILGSLEQFNHILLCLPPGTRRRTNSSETHWTAYATRGGRFTVYNDGAYTNGVSACAQSSTIMHEIGHNLGLHHSDRYDDGEHRRYEDKSGLMGTSYNLPDGRGPKMCYNAPHLKQLGWVDQSNIRTIPQASLTTSHTIETLYGVYSEINEGINRKEMIIIPELTSASNPGANKDYYISYNAMKGPNTGALMGGNAVLVHHSSGVGRPSELVAQLRLNHNVYSNEYSILINSEYITIEVIEINTVSGYARVRVKGGNDTTLETPAPSPPLILGLPACTGNSTVWAHSINPSIITCDWLYTNNGCSLYGDCASDDGSTADAVCPGCDKCILV